MLRSLAPGMIALALFGGGDRAGLAWSRADDPELGAQLVLAGPGTDDARLLLACQPGSGAVEVTVVGRREDGAILELRSGKLRNRYAGAGAPDAQIDGAFDVRARLAAADPVLARFADTGELAVILGERRTATPNGFAPAHDFLQVCELPPAG